ncbi:glutamate--tRNA ligase [Candidatus Dependentiae bacterium]|nr:glutamate--tRNA ligase [Candidatus Dependentiae bacterium]
MNKQHSTPRVRFAPSPTGYLHIGGLRAAFFNWLFARHNNGVFLLRIEDTDGERSKPEYTQAILDAFDWVGLHSDEPIVIQSQRIARHKEVIESMLVAGTAYKCFCTIQELQERLGASAAQEGSYTKYDEKCRTRVTTIGDEQKSCVVRFKVPSTIKEVAFDDLIHGPLVFDKEQFDDFIIMRSDGSPMYNFVVVVDDADMRISHVLRGDDHIANTPKQILLYTACGFTMPQFGHLPMILGADGQRLSKRHAATSVLDYRVNGFLPDALCNYLVRLGWSHGNQEIFSREELMQYFSLEQVGKKAAIFDSTKLEWLNSVYIKQTPAQELLEYSIKCIDPALQVKLSGWHTEQLLSFIDLYKDRVKTLRELLDELYSVYARPSMMVVTAEMEPWIHEKNYHNMKHLELFLIGLEDYSVQALTVSIKDFINKQALTMPEMGKPLRIALTGKTASPGVFELLALLGKQESIERLHAFIILLKESLKKH